MLYAPNPNHMLVFLKKSRNSKNENHTDYPLFKVPANCVHPQT